MTTETERSKLRWVWVLGPMIFTWMSVDCVWEGLSTGFAALTAIKLTLFVALTVGSWISVIRYVRL